MELLDLQSGQALVVRVDHYSLTNSMSLPSFSTHLLENDWKISHVLLLCGVKSTSPGGVDDDISLAHTLVSDNL